MAFGLSERDTLWLGAGALAYLVLFRGKDLLSSFQQSPQQAAQSALLNSQPPTVAAAVTIAQNAPSSAYWASQLSFNQLAGPAGQAALSSKLLGPAIANSFVALGQAAPPTNKELSASMSLLPAYRYG